MPIEPASFVAVVDNPWFPLIPGTTFHYRGVADGEPTTDTYEVTHQTRVVDGVSTTVIKDTVRVRGVVEERTEDWYAQDVDGNVWYFGEATAELDKHGKVTNTGGPWEAGVDGARHGVYMPANPDIGKALPQEQFPGEAEDWFVVLFTGMRVRTLGTYPDAMVTGEWTPLEPDRRRESGTPRGRPGDGERHLGRTGDAPAGEGHGPLTARRVESRHDEPAWRHADRAGAEPGEASPGSSPSVAGASRSAKTGCRARSRSRSGPADPARTRSTSPSRCAPRGTRTSWPPASCGPRG
jgi:hypothetical protein